MAKIIENSQGHQMIRLSPHDVLTVVSLYQQHLYGQTRGNYQELLATLGQHSFYLPTEG